MPKRLVIIALLFCSCGVYAIWDVLWGLTHERVNINFGVLMLPVGIGLFRAKESSRIWARVWLCFFIVVGLVMMCLAPTATRARAHFFSWQVEGTQAVPWVMLMGAAFAAGSFFLCRQVRSKRLNDYFYDVEEARIRAAMAARGGIQGTP